MLCSLLACDLWNNRIGRTYGQNGAMLGYTKVFDICVFLLCLHKKRKRSSTLSEMGLFSGVEWDVKMGRQDRYRSEPRIFRGATAGQQPVPDYDTISPHHIAVLIEWCKQFALDRSDNAGAEYLEDRSASTAVSPRRHRTSCGYYYFLDRIRGAPFRIENIAMN